MACRDCKWWDDIEARDKAGRILSKRVAKCRWALSALKVIQRPDSIYERDWNNVRGHYMQGTDGAECAAFEPREERDEP